MKKKTNFHLLAGELIACFLWIFLMAGAQADSLPAPGNFQITQTDIYHLNLTWDAVAGAQSYRVETLIYEVGEAIWFEETKTDSTSYRFDGSVITTQSHDAFFRVAALDAAGQPGEYSKVVYGNTGPFYTSIQVTPSNEFGTFHNTVTVRYDHYSGEENGATYDEFEIYRSDASGENKLLATVPCNLQFMTYYEDADLTPGAAYTYYARKKMMGDRLYPENPELLPGIGITESLGYFRTIPTEKVSVTVPSRVEAPKITTALRKGNAYQESGVADLAISWNAVSGADVYSLYCVRVTERPKSVSSFIQSTVIPPEVCRNTSWEKPLSEEGIYAILLSPGKSGRDDLWFEWSDFYYVAVLNVPADLKAEEKNGKVNLTWNHTTSMSNISWRINRREGDGEWLQVGTSSGKKWTDEKTSIGKTYEYAVCPILTDANFGTFSGLQSDSVQIRVTTSSPVRITKGGLVYEANPGEKTAVVTGPEKTGIKTASIPATIKAGGVTCKVTGIKAGAFSGCTKLTTVTIGKNVTSIGKKAFYGARKLKTITIKTKLLTSSSIGANAFKGIAGNATIKCPSRVKKEYRTILLKKGATKKMTIK